MLKQILRFTAIIAIISMMAVVFCSCDRLDELRESRATFTENGISYKGNEYVKIQYSSHFLSLTSNDIISLNITDEDVPLLLSGIYPYGTSGEYEKSHEIIQCDGSFYVGKKYYSHFKDVIESPAEGLSTYGIYNYSQTDMSKAAEFLVVPDEVKHVLDEARQKIQNGDSYELDYADYSEYGTEVVFLCCDSLGVMTDYQEYNMSVIGGKVYITDNVIGQYCELDSDEAAVLLKYTSQINTQRYYLI